VFTIKKGQVRSCNSTSKHHQHHHGLVRLSKENPAAMATVGEVATIEPQLPQLDVVHGPKECKECKELQTAEAELIRWIPEVCKW
jgi:hypothetical protein